MPAQQLITITQWSGKESAADLRRDIEEAANDGGFQLGQLVPDPENSRVARTLYVAGPGIVKPGTPDNFLDFGDAMHTTVQPLTDLGLHSPVGNWVVFGDSEDTLIATRVLHEHGAETLPQALTTSPQLGQLPQSAKTIIAAFVLLLFGTTAAFVVTRTRRYAIARMHGRRLLSGWRQEVVPFFYAWLAGGVATLIVGVALTVARFDGVGLGPLVLQALAISTVFLVGVGMAFVLLLAVTHSMPLLAALKGDIPGRTIVLSSYVLRSAAIALALGLGATSASLLVDGQARAEAERPLQELRGAAVLTLGNAFTEEDQNLLGRTVEAWLADLDAEGKVLLAKQETIGGGDSMIAPHPTLLVNDKYLDEQHIGLHDETVLSREALNQDVTVMIPPELWPNREAVVAEAKTLLELRTRDAGRDLSTRTLEARASQVVATYSSPSEVAGAPLQQDQQAFLRDAIIIVMPPNTYEGYVSAVSAGELIVLDPDVVRAQVQQDAQLQRFVLSVTPATAKADLIASEKQSEFRSASFAAAISYLVLLLAGIAVAGGYAKQFATRIFVQHLNGWRISKTYRALIVVEALLLSFILAWAPFRVAQERSELAQLQEISPLPGGLPTLGVLDIVPVSLVALLATGGFGIALLLAHRWIIRNGISEA
ncbi:hypothetical protein [Ornithinimicrobium panacihumi]|uniref:hypothetical protein n=1 Tax=Ornithinimicrobium panacihumi TaxID=2008449 RepID=UPI003F8A9488